MVSIDLINKLNQASKYLKNNDRSLDADELDDFSKQLQDVNIGKEKLEEIKKRIVNKCDIRWLGDIHIKEMKNPYEWWNLLGDIKLLLTSKSS